VKKLYDKAQSDERLDEDWRKRVREWLQFNSRYYVDELVASVRKVKDKEGYVANEEVLKALAKVDADTAAPLLQALANGNQPRSAAVALALLYRNARVAKDAMAEAKYRERLRTVAADRNAPAHARDTAIEVLSLTEWSGRDEWYLSLFEDETLLQLHDGSFGYSPLTYLFARDAEKWIPVMSKLVEHQSRSVQQGAASCLVLYAIDHPRRDAILPVLRWLTDPDWINISGTEWIWFVQKMDELDMPESVPSLIWIVEHDEDINGYTARTLAHYKDPRAIPALKKALAREANEDTRQNIIQGLIASSGVSEAEQLGALEAYAAKLATSEGRQEVERYRSYGDDPLPLPVSIGMYLARQKSAPDSLVIAVLARAESLQRTNPAQARALLGITQSWQARQVELDMLRRIAAGTADAATIDNALERRAQLHERVGPELQALAGTSGAPQGIAAVLLADDALAQHILGAGDQRAQMALLACARLTQRPLPGAQVGTLLGSKNPNLALAAERYLLAEDSKEARQLVLARHPREAFITGWRENVSLIGGSNFDAMGKAEDGLRAELFIENGPLEIIALLMNNERPSRVVRVYSDKAVYTAYEDAARFRERIITNEELARLKNFLTTNNITELGPQFGQCHYDCAAYEFLALARQSGRRVFSHQSAFAWVTVFANFELLGKGDGGKIHYRLADEIKGLEVLHADDTLPARDVWQQGADVRVFVERAETPEEIEQPQKADNDTAEEDDEAARVKHRRQEAARARARFSWRAFAAGKLGAVTQPPGVYAPFDESTFEIDNNVFPSHLNEYQAQARAGDFVVLAGSFGAGGLWKKASGQAAVRISNEGIYANPLVTPDGKWAVAAKTDSDWGQPNYVVRLNLQTGCEERVHLPPADQFEPVAYIAAHGQILLRRAKDEDGNGSKANGPETPEFYLLDAATGHVRSVTGVFTPLQQEGRRALQSTGKPAEVWAAIPDRANNQTRVGRYNSSDFSFQPLLVVPHITFNSMAMWVDESAAKLYVIYEGHLLRLPLRSVP
jgi:hypothetical protein